MRKLAILTAADGGGSARTRELGKALLGAGLAVALGFAVADGNQALAQGSWESSVFSDVTPMPTARNSPHVGAIGGFLYVAGGDDGGGKTVLEAYDPSADSWTTKAPMLGRRYAGAAGVIDGKLYVAGGWNAPDSFIPTNTLQIYDPVGNSWSYGPSLPHLSGCGTAGVIAGKLYVLTPCLGFGFYFKVFDMYNPDTLTWSAKTQPANIHVGPASGVIAGKLYVAGGSDGFVPTATLEVYDPGTNIPGPPRPRCPRPGHRHLAGCSMASFMLRGDGMAAPI